MSLANPLSSSQSTASALTAEAFVTEVNKQASASIFDQLDQVADAISAETQRERLAPTPPKLSIVIPAFNERDTIEKIIGLVRELDIDKQIIVVDDGSTDGTRDILASLPTSRDLEIFLHESNQGKGAALQTGFRLAEGDIVIVQDADLEYNPQDILKVIEPILKGEADVVYGSRYLAKTHENSSWLHRFGNWLLTQLSNWTHQQKLTDMETCYKAMRRQVLQGIRIEQQRFGFEPEITAKLARGGHAIREVSVRYQARSWREGKKIGIRDLLATLYCIFRYRYFA